MEYGIALAWNWEYDREFIFGLEYACTRVNISTYRIEPHNVEETTQRVRNGDLRFFSFLDRASDDDESFESLTRLLSKNTDWYINPAEKVHHARDKANMHLELLTAGIHVPYTIIISPYNKKTEVELKLTELSLLGRPFIIKPANTTGGGIGVVLGAESLKDVIETRQHHKNDKYLLQKKIIPTVIDGHRAWFRVFYAFGDVMPCWWDPDSHYYLPLTKQEIKLLKLQPLGSIVKAIQKVCRLDFFSSEIALTEERRFVVVDYVNEVCDMRLQSIFADGVPDLIVERIQQLIVKSIRQRIRLNFQGPK